MHAAVRVPYFTDPARVRVVMTQPGLFRGWGSTPLGRCLVVGLLGGGGSYLAGDEDCRARDAGASAHHLCLFEEREPCGKCFGEGELWNTWRRATKLRELGGTKSATYVIGVRREMSRWGSLLAYPWDILDSSRLILLHFMGRPALLDWETGGRSSFQRVSHSLVAPQVVEGTAPRAGSVK